MKTGKLEKNYECFVPRKFLLNLDVKGTGQDQRHCLQSRNATPEKAKWPKNINSKNDVAEDWLQGKIEFGTTTFEVVRSQILKYKKVDSNGLAT